MDKMIRESLNTKTMHRTTKWRRMLNMFKGTYIGSEWCEESRKVKQEIFEKFTEMLAKAEK